MLSYLDIALDIAGIKNMTRIKNRNLSSQFVRNSLWNAIDNADQIHELEIKLIERLYQIDAQRLYVRFGYKSLMGFCNIGLKFSKTQSQRIVTSVRRYEPTSNLGIKGDQYAYERSGLDTVCSH